MSFDDAVRRDKEAEVLALLDKIAVTVEMAQALIQDDSRISDDHDAPSINLMMMTIRALSCEVERVLYPITPGVSRYR